VQEFETPEARRAEVDSGRQIQKDTRQQIMYFGWKYFGKKQGGEFETPEA
jgi:hypothetical protein